MRVSVKLNKGWKDYISSRKRKGERQNEFEKREYRHGLAVFYNDKFVLDFVVSNEEVEFLQSDSKVKAIDDLGFMLYTTGYTLTIMKYYNGYEKDSSFLDEIKLKNGEGYKTMNVYSELHFYSEEKGKFAEAISLAMKYPEEGTNLWSRSRRL